MNMSLSRFISNDAKLGVAPDAQVPPLFMPRLEIIYIYVLHFSARLELIKYMHHRL